MNARFDKFIITYIPRKLSAILKACKEVAVTPEILAFKVRFFFCGYIGEKVMWLCDIVKLKGIKLIQVLLFHTICLQI